MGTRNSLCVFCYKSASPIPNSSKRNFLLFLFKYLKYDALVEGRDPQVPKEELRLCGYCSKLGDSFSNLYLQLETIQLQLNNEVRCIYERMITSDYIPSRCTQFQKQFESRPGQNGQQKLGLDIKRMRKELIEHCKKNLSNEQEASLAQNQAQLKNENELSDDFDNDDFIIPDIKMEVEELEDDGPSLSFHHYSQQLTKPETATTSSTSRRVLLKCPKCSKTFSSPNSLNSHLQTHEEQTSESEDDEEEEEEKVVEIQEEAEGGEGDSDRDDVIELDDDYNTLSTSGEEEDGDDDDDDDYEEPSKASYTTKAQERTWDWDYPNFLPPTQCEQCQKKFDSETAVEKHRVVDHSLKNFLRCPGCGATFPSFMHLRMHRNRPNLKDCYVKNILKALQPASSSEFPFSVGSNSRIFCTHDNCYEAFQNEEQRFIHLRTHGTWNCQHCEVVFEKAHDLAWHEITKHNKKMESVPEKIEDDDDDNLCYKCTRCQRSQKLWKKRALLSHFMNIHLKISHLPDNAIASVQCPICKKAFHAEFRKSDMDHHIKQEHDVEGLDPSLILHCTICQVPFTNQGSLTNHMKAVHKTERMYPCSECPKVYNNCKFLRTHFRKNHKGCTTGLKGKYECHICKEKFEIVFNLETHIKSHEKEAQPKAPQVYSCKLCDKVVGRQDSLRRHMNTKHRPHTFCCDHCGKLFGTKARLTEHSYSHENNHVPGGNPIVCEFCGKAFKNRPSLTVHIRKRHKAERDAARAPHLKSNPVAEFISF